MGLKDTVARPNGFLHGCNDDKKDITENVNETAAQAKCNDDKKEIIKNSNALLNGKILYEKKIDFMNLVLINFEN